MTPQLPDQPPAAPPPLSPEALSDRRLALGVVLRMAREAKGLSIDDVSRITRITARNLEHLEGGELERLPGDVFVRGFLRSYASVVGLNPQAVVARYAVCGLAPSPVAAHARATTEELDPLDMALDAPATDPVLLAVEPRNSGAVQLQSAVQNAVQPGPDGVRERGKRTSKKKRGKPRGTAKWQAAARDAEPASARVESPSVPLTATTPAGSFDTTPAPVAAEALPAQSAPSLVIDDADPEAAAREQERREDERSNWFSLPAALRGFDRSSRQGALTVAVIVLVIVAAITLSYLMTRPSSRAPGVTQGTPSLATQVPVSLE